MLNIKKLFRGVALLLILAMAISCSSSKSTSSSSDDDETTTTFTVTGTATNLSSRVAQVQESATAAQSFLSNPPKYSLSHLDPRFLTAQGADSSPLSNASVRLYKIVNGVVQASNPTSGTTDSAGKFTFDSVEPGAYTIHVFKTGKDVNGQNTIVRSTGFLYVTAAGEIIGSTVSERTYLVLQGMLESMVKAAADEAAASNNRINANDLVNNALKELFDAYLSTIDNLINNGVITIDDDVDTYDPDSTDFDDIQDAKEADLLALEKVLESETLISQKKVFETAAQLEIEPSKLSDEKAREFIRSVFGIAASSSSSAQGNSATSREGKTEDDGGDIPDFFINQLAEAYKTGVTANIEIMGKAYHDSISDAQSVLKANWPASDLTTRFVNGASTKLRELYDWYDDSSKATPNISNLEVVKVVFPKASDKRLPLDRTSLKDAQLNVPKVIIIMGLSGLFEESALLEKNNYKSTTEYQNFDKRVDIDHVKFISDLGVLTIDRSSLYVISSEVRAVKTWVEVSNDNWRETDALDARLEIYTQAYSSGDVKVEMNYPKKDGSTGTVALKKRVRRNGDKKDSIVKLSILRAADNADKSAHYNASLTTQAANDTLNETWAAQPWHDGNKANSLIISDFKGGDVEFRVINTSTSAVLATATANILKVDLNPIQWVSPAGPDMEKIFKQGYDPDFQAQAFALDTGISGVRPTLKWKTPTLNSGSIPSDHFIAYALHLGVSGHKINHSKSGSIDFNKVKPQKGKDWNEKNNSDGWAWYHLWDTWETGRYVNATSFELPIDLEANTRNVTENIETRYEVNIRPLLVHKKSRRVVWEGSESRTEFFVKDAALASPWVVTLNGTIKFPSDIATKVTRDGKWKIGLFTMHGKGSDGRWGPQFFTKEAGARTPIGGNTPLVADLGTTSEITSSGLTYELPPLKKVDAHIKRDNFYQLVIWHDETTAGGSDQWSGLTATAGKIDYSTTYYTPAEPFDVVIGGFRLEGGSLIFESQEGNQAGAWRIFADGHDDEKDQKIDYTVGSRRNRF